MGFKNIMKKGKDLTIGKTLKIYFNKRIENYGSVKKLSLNSTEKSLSMIIHLKGEESEIAIDIDNYKISEENSEIFLNFYKIKTSKIWLTNFLRDHVEGINFNLPAKYKGMIEGLL